MKVRLYLRLARDRHARDGWRAHVALKPNHRSLTDTADQPLHTLRLALEIEVPDSLLRPTEWPKIEIVIPAELVERIPEEIHVEATAP